MADLTKEDEEDKEDKRDVLEKLRNYFSETEWYDPKTWDLLIEATEEIEKLRGVPHE